jgi:DNA-binding TFAR19-related protein (PDSD5 family)
MQELQRRISQIQTPPPTTPSAKKEPTNIDIFNAYFGDRAWEIWNAAKEQYPTIITRVEEALIQAIKDGKIHEKIDGAALAQFFRGVGLPVRLNTQIRYAEHGELKTLEQKLKSES